ncbi:MAG: PTS sugar transporter subunit IIA [Deltaproteobacteria bacterium]|nr:PTS sugar transporter subunit IIA [Deltaproteobacteria bacterium]
MNIGDILKPECVVYDIKASTKKEILAELAGPISQVYGVPLDEMVEVLLNREKLGSTGIGDGVAIPHGKIKGLSAIAASIGKSKSGLRFDALDGKPCHIFFLLVAPADSISGHLKALARASMLLKNASLRDKLMDANSAEALYQFILEQDKILNEQS